MEGMKNKFNSQIYSNISVNEEVDKRANLDYSNIYNRKANLMVEQRDNEPAPVNVIRSLLAQLMEDKRSDSTGTYSEMKRMAAYFVENYKEFDNEMEIKAIAALHARACDYYNLHSSRPRRSTLGKNRLRISTSIMTQLRNLIDSFDDQKKNLAMIELCQFEAPKPLIEGEKEYKTDVSANSKPLMEYFAKYSAKLFLQGEEGIDNPTDEQIADVLKRAPYMNSRTAALLLRSEAGNNNYDNLIKFLPEGVDMDSYLKNSLYTAEQKRIVQQICPKFCVDKNGNPLRPIDAVNMAKAQKNMESMASGDPIKMQPIIDDFVQSLCDVKVPDIAAILQSDKGFEDYAFKHIAELKDYTNLFTNLENLIMKIPSMKDYYESAYTQEFRDKLKKKGEIVPLVAEKMNATAVKYGLNSFFADGNRMIHYNDYKSSVQIRETVAEGMLEAAGDKIQSFGGLDVLNEKMDALYEKSVAKYGKKHVVFIDEKEPYEKKNDELIVPYLICQEEHRGFALEVLEPFLDMSKMRSVINDDVSVIEKIMNSFRKKRCIFNGKYPVPNISECERILKSGTDEEKITLEICLTYHLDVLPVTIKDDPCKISKEGEVLSDNYKKLNEFKDRLDIAVYGDIVEFYNSDRKNYISEDDAEYIKPSKEMGKKVLRMLGSFLAAKNLERAKFLREEVEKAGGDVNRLTGKEKGIILLKSIVAGVDADLMTGISLVSECFGIMANVVPMLNAFLQSPDMFKDDYELIHKFGDGGNFMGVAHSFMMSDLPEDADEETKQRFDEDATETIQQYIGDYEIQVRDEFRKAGMYCMPFTDNLIKKFGEAVGITDFTDKHNSGKEDTFYKLVVEPLENVIKLSPLTADNKRQAGYPQSLHNLTTKLADYKKKHNPHSDIGKERLKLVNELIELLRDGIEGDRIFELGEDAIGN